MTYQLGEGRYKLAVSGVHINSTYEPRFLPPQDLQAGTDLFELLLLSAQYNGEHWGFTSEYALRHTDDQGFGVSANACVFRMSAFTGESYYFQGMYRDSAKWEAFLRYDVFYADRDDRDGEKSEAPLAFPVKISLPKTGPSAPDTTLPQRSWWPPSITTYTARDGCRARTTRT